VKRVGQHSSDDINHIQRDDKARDDVKAAFAGNENKGPAKDQKTSERKDSHLKSRNTARDTGRTPII
jgi:hypothetical protein